MRELLLYLLALTFLQNLVLSTGLGSSLLIRLTRRPRDILAYSGILCVFMTLSVLAAYPLDQLIGTGTVAKLLRPTMMIAVAAALYLLVTPLLRRFTPALYQRIAHLLPLAAFNNMIIGVLLILNHQFSMSLPGAIGIAIGSSLGFVLLSYLTVEGMERLDNPDLPAAFRGLPATLLFLGILALAITGFQSDISLL